jgi:hypothetical protein
MRLLLALLFEIALIGGEANAHTRSQSLSRWSIDGDTLQAHVEADAIDVTRLYAFDDGDASLDEIFAREAAQAFQVSADGQPCALSNEPQASVAQAGRVVANLRFTCPIGATASGAISIESALFLSVAPSHLHFVALRDAEGRVAEAVLTAPNPGSELDPAGVPATQSFGETVARFLPVGAEHVWTGLDHVAFILALVLLTAGGLRAVLLAATGFTLGHTATLGFAAVGVLRPDTAAIEALIGFTIAFVALEAGERGGARMLQWSAPFAGALAAGGIAASFGLIPMSPIVWFGLAAFVFAYPRGFPRGATWLALIFGLIHGCGFAGALSELELPRPRLLASLLGFNLGVEFGQIVVIAAALCVAFLARRAPAPMQRQGVSLAGAALFALGAYWFASRLLTA